MGEGAKNSFAFKLAEQHLTKCLTILSFLPAAFRTEFKMVGQTSVTFVAGDARLALTYASPVALAALRSYALQDTAYRDVATYLRDIVYTTLCLKKKQDT